MIPSWLLPPQGADFVFRLARQRGNTRKPVVIEGRFFPSLTAAARALGVSITTIYNKVQRNDKG